MAFLKEESNILFSFPSNPEPDENTDISFIPMHPVAQGHDDLNSTRCHHVIRVWMSYLEKKTNKHENACGTAAVGAGSDWPNHI